MITVIEFRAEARPDGSLVDWVHFAGRDGFNESGQITTSTWARVKDLQPTEMIRGDDDGLRFRSLMEVWRGIEPAYQAWKAGLDVPETGTPLAAWPALSKAELTTLHKIGLKSVEAVAEMRESVAAGGALPNMRALKANAKSWLEGRDAETLQKRIADLEAREAAMMEMLEQATAAAEKRGPGRPRKEPEAA